MLPRAFCVCLLLVLAAVCVAGQQSAAGAPRLQITRDEASSTLVLRAGPIKLPSAAYAGELEAGIPLTGWAVAFKLRLVDGSGQEVAGPLLRLAALENLARRDLACPGQPGRLFAAYSAPLAFPEFPGIGFAIERGGKARLRLQLDRGEREDTDLYVEVTLHYREQGKTALPVVSVLPLWIEASECAGAGGQASADLPPGGEVRRRQFQVSRNGKLLAAAATGSQFAQRILLERMPGEMLADLTRQAETGFPLANWMPRGGMPVTTADHFRLTVEFSNPAPATQRGAGRAAILAYFLPLENK